MAALSEVVQWRKLLGVADSADAIGACRSFERLANTLAPIELSGLHCYAMPVSAMPEELLPLARYRDGWIFNDSYSLVRHLLPDDRGPGPVLFVVDINTPESDHIAAAGAQAYFRERGEEVSIEELLTFARPPGIDAICGILVHELAHAIDDIASGVFEENLDTHTEWSAAVHLRRIVAQKERQTEPTPMQLDCHGLRFTRIVCHLDYRLRSLGVVSTKLSTAGNRYQQRPYDECFEALGDEPRRHRKSSFAEILSLPMPERFEACLLTEVLQT